MASINSPFSLHCDFLRLCCSRKVCAIYSTSLPLESMAVDSVSKPQAKPVIHNHTFTFHIHYYVYLTIKTINSIATTISNKAFYIFFITQQFRALSSVTNFHHSNKVLNSLKFLTFL